MKKIMGVLAFVLLILMFSSGFFEVIANVFAWLVTLNFDSPSISAFGQLVVRYGTWLVTYGLVGIVFGVLGWFNSAAMKITYFAISAIISFLLNWFIMALEQYWLVISIAIGALFICVVAIGILIVVKRKKCDIKNS